MLTTLDLADDRGAALCIVLVDIRSLKSMRACTDPIAWDLAPRSPSSGYGRPSVAAEVSTLLRAVPPVDMRIFQVIMSVASARHGASRGLRVLHHEVNQGTARLMRRSEEQISKVNPPGGLSSPGEIV